MVAVSIVLVSQLSQDKNKHEAEKIRRTCAVKKDEKQNAYLKTFPAPAYELHISLPTDPRLSHRISPMALCKDGRLANQGLNPYEPSVGSSRRFERNWLLADVSLKICKHFEAVKEGKR